MIISKRTPPIIRLKFTFKDGLIFVNPANTFSHTGSGARESLDL